MRKGACGIPAKGKAGGMGGAPAPASLPGAQHTLSLDNVSRIMPKRLLLVHRKPS